MEAFTSMMIDEGARRRFEAAWRSGTPPDIDPFLPPPGDPAWLATLTELVLIDIEMKWKRRQSDGEAADRIEDYLCRFPALAAPKVLHQLVQHEFGIRKRLGDDPSETEYGERFPQLIDGSKTLMPSAGETRVRPGMFDAVLAPAIPGYEIERLLGRGGMGMVFLARQTRLKRLVALKMILAGRYADADDLARFRGEAESIARLQHPNIIQIYEVGEAGERPYFSMEYAGGGTLAEQLGGTPLPADVAADLVRTLAEAVQYAHENGIVHRDLKPGNVLFGLRIAECGLRNDKQDDADDSESKLPLAVDSIRNPQSAFRNPKITDFGLAKQLDADDGRTKTGTILGTPSYMAPEQAAGQWREVGKSADIYALGAILYECLTGRPPFKAATSLETLEQVRSQEPVPPRQLQPKTPRDLETICLKCLEKQPAKRYASAAELAADLARFRNHEPILARPVSSIERAVRWCRRKPYQAALAGTIAMVAVGLVAGLFLWQRADFRKEKQILALQARQENDARQQLEARRKTAEANRDRGLAELAANRFDSAEQFLQQAVHHAADGEGLEELHKEVRRQHEDIAKLRRFYEKSQKAELLAFVEREDRAKQLCEDMLREFDVLEGDVEWWKRLPVKQLSTAQAEQLRFDANHQLLLLAALHMKHALLNVKGEASKQAYRQALVSLERVHAFHDAHQLPQCVSAQVLANMCHFNLGQVSKMKRITSQPGTASDCYFFGVAYYWLVMSPQGKLTETIKWAFGLLGLDTSDPSAIAQNALRKAVSQDPRHHWSYLWLGWTLQTAKDYRSSELAFSSCITLRPDDAIGYAERGRAIALQARALPEQKLDAKKEKTLRQELWQRCRADLDRAVARNPNDWYIQLRRLEALALFDEKEEALDAARAVLEATPSPDRLVGLPADETAQLLKNVHTYVHENWPPPTSHPEAQGVLALILLRYGNYAEADKAASAAFAVPSSDRRASIIRAAALYVRGQILLRSGHAQPALAAFDQATALRPMYFDAALGRASALALAGDHIAALAACDTAMPLAGNDWQKLEVHLERIAALLTLQRFDEAEQELAKARALHPQIADEFRRRWFDK